MIVDPSALSVRVDLILIFIKKLLKVDFFLDRPPDSASFVCACARRQHVWMSICGVSGFALCTVLTYQHLGPAGRMHTAHNIFTKKTKVNNEIKKHKTKKKAKIHIEENGLLL